MRIRTARPKDEFAPFGMGGKHQLVADYFKNKSFSQYQKSRTWILFDQNGIIALLGERSSEAYKIDKRNASSQLLKIEWIPNLESKN
jgi:tRNA(Ile)-lysidine synthase